jgi:hypothetical protein
VRRGTTTLVKRAFATLSVAALAAGVLGGARAAAPKAGASARPANPCASKTSKFARAQCESYTRSAPGDEYFGRMKLSYLGINNTFRDEAVRAGAYTTEAGLISRVNFADEALRAWAAKYPGDPQLSRSYFLGIQVMRKIYTQPAQDRAWQIMQILTKAFPSSYFGKVMARSLKVGFTEHYFAVPLPCPSPQPTSAPGARARPTPTPSPTPEPSPTPTPAPNQPKVVVLTPPCVIVTPSPAPTLVPVPAPSGTPPNWPLPGAAPIRGVGSPVPPTPAGPLTPQPTTTPKAL